MSDARPGDPTSRAVSACHEPFHEALEVVESRLSTGVVAALENAREVHGELVTTAGLAGEAPSTWEERSEALLQYRRRLAADVLGPIRTTFRGAGPTAGIVSALQSAIREARESARALPPSVEDLWPEGALDSRPSDRAGRRARKAVGRLFSAARKAGTPRAVPLRAVALHHLQQTLAPDIDAAATELLRTWAAWERDIERAWIEWGEGALSALVESEVREPSEDEEKPEPEKETGSTGWDEIGQAATDLDERLSSLIANSPLPVLQREMESRLREACAALEADLAVAGSLVFEPENTHRIDPQLSAVARLAPTLEAWDRGVEQRLRLYESILAILAGASAVQRRLVDQVREEHLGGSAVLTRVADELEELSDRLPVEIEDPAVLVEQLDRLDATVATVLEPTESALPSAPEVESAVQDRANAAVDALVSMVRQAPATLDLHGEDGRLPSGAREAEIRSVPFQELARQSFDALRIERIRSSTQAARGRRRSAATGSDRTSCTQRISR